ncbi:MAG: hypothetical protein ABSC65_18635 [Acidobacteriaceae bacterium]
MSKRIDCRSGGEPRVDFPIRVSPVRFMERFLASPAGKPVVEVNVKVNFRIY